MGIKITKNNKTVHHVFDSRCATFPSLWIPHNQMFRQPNGTLAISRGRGDGTGRSHVFIKDKFIE